MSTKKMSPLVRLAVCGMLIALDIVLTRFASVNLWNQRIGFSFVAVALAGYFCGPLGGLLVHGISDFLGAVLFPSGPYFPGFTLTAAILGLIYGICFYRNQTLWRIAVGVLAAAIICTVGLNTLWISINYQSPFLPLLPGRLIQAGASSAVQILVLPAIFNATKRIPLF